MSVDCVNLKVCDICYQSHPTSLHELSIRRSLKVEKSESITSEVVCTTVRSENSDLVIDPVKNEDTVLLTTLNHRMSTKLRRVPS